MIPLVITRVEQPPIQPSRHEAAESIVGGQFEWCWASGYPYIATNSPGAPVVMPAVPTSDSDFFRSLSYWATLQGFLTYSFGWTRHDRGLRWWYDAGKPLDDERFALIDAVWETDGNLLTYVEWTHDRLDWMRQQALTEWCDYDATHDQLTDEWRRRLEAARREGPTARSPYEMHLENGTHTAGPASPAGISRLVVTSRVDRRAALVSETALGWYRDLVEQGGALPPAASSWKVDVFAKPVGFLGTYRRSWKTGLWFAGRHRYHSVGN